MADFELGTLLYENALRSPGDVSDWRLEGEASITFPRSHMRLEQMHEKDPESNKCPHYVFWCPEDFPADISVSWKFLPHTDAGLAMFWFCAAGCNGEDLFDPNLDRRDGMYKKYHHGDINAYHLSYFRRNPNGEINFQTCNLRKSYGFYLVKEVGDPLPGSTYANEFYQIQLIKCENAIRFYINDLPILAWDDDGETYGPVWGEGKIGFRQMTGLMADYKDLKVHQVRRAN